jgi:hypothetical protein
MKEYEVKKTVSFTIRVVAESEAEAQAIGWDYDTQTERLNGKPHPAIDYQIEEIEVEGDEDYE